MQDFKTLVVRTYLGTDQNWTCSLASWCRGNVGGQAPSVDVEFISSEFDIFVKKPTQSAILDSHVVRFKPIATVDQNDLEFLVPGDNETYRPKL